MAGTRKGKTPATAVRSGALDVVAVPMDLGDLVPAGKRSKNPRRSRLDSVRLHEMVAIHKLSQAVALTMEPDAILDRVAGAALSQFGAEEVSILLPTPDGGDLYVAAVRGSRREQILGERVPISSGVVGWVARHRQAVRMDGEIDDARFAPIVPRPDIHSAMSMPMVVGGRFVGVLNVSTTRRRRFTLGQVRALSILSSTAAAALEHARLHAESRQAAVRNAELYSQLQSAYDQLQQAQDRIVQQERMRALGQMASGIVHDFNNALVPILGFSELLLTEPQAVDLGSVRRSLELIHMGAQDAAKVVARLSEFYRRREEGELFQPVNLNRVVEQVVSLSQPRWRDQALAAGVTIRVETDLDQGLPFISGSEAELREALLNLVFNAVDAMRTRGQLTLRTRSNSSFVEVGVIDTGGGMTEFVREHCLEPLFSTKEEHGTGFGLAMVYGTIQRHAGTIEIQSELGRGTTVLLRLPVTSGAPEDDTHTESPALGVHLRVLVIDAEPAIREVVSSYLARDGHLVEVAESGCDGLERFREASFDVVVTDHGMPEMRGDELALAVKAASPHTPVILLTGFGDLMRASGEQPPGVDVVVAKPVELTHLRTALAGLFVGGHSASPVATGHPKGTKHARRRSETA